ncbi:MAG: sulfite exporter TauE/SafE family protein [Polynucleobacter sp.]|nr:sulfite exporter TauE/SafE family protein [Polynucleobacter sp.]
MRGFAGFGFSALSVAGLSLFVPPATVIPALLLLEVVASIGLIRTALPDLDRDWWRSLLLGNIVFIPLGIAALAMLSEARLRFLVGGVLLVGALLLKAMSGRKLAPTPVLKMLAGVLSGVLNGLTASGGVVAAMLMSAARVSPAALRGTMVIFLLFSGCYALIWAGLLSQAAATPLLGVDTLRWALLLSPGMFAGIWIGHRQFSRAHPSSYRSFVLNLLILVSALGLIRSLMDLATQ